MTYRHPSPCFCASRRNHALYKVAGDGEASVARYETLCSQWARFSPAIVHRMLRQKLLEHGTSVQEFTCQR